MFNKDISVSETTSQSISCSLLKYSLPNWFQIGPKFCAHRHQGTVLEWQNLHQLALLTPDFTDPILDGHVAPFCSPGNADPRQPWEKEQFPTWLCPTQRQMRTNASHGDDIHSIKVEAVKHGPLSARNLNGEIQIFLFPLTNLHQLLDCS